MYKGLNGILVVDKPAGMTSAMVVNRLKKITGVKKAGHTGTLDPFATGLMICCLNKATRLARFFLVQEKKYTGGMVLGKETDTLDSTGEFVSACDQVNLSRKEIETAFEEFKGMIMQAPPVFSALKHNGVPLYKLARAGRPVQKPPRQVSVFSIRVIEVDLPRVKFEVECSSGTYIRSLCSDIGKKLGCGAYLESLRRTQCCGFLEKDAINLDDIEKLALSGKLSDKVISMTDALPLMDEWVVDSRLKNKILQGGEVTAEDFQLPGNSRPNGNDAEGKIKIIDEKRKLLAVARHDKTNDAVSYICVFPDQGM